MVCGSAEDTLRPYLGSEFLTAVGMKSYIF
jgi:hypothetical protein